MLITLVLLVAIVALVYVFLVWNNNYWKDRRVPGPEPRLLVGSYPSLFTQKRSLALEVDDIYR